jgi:hypothetical protein
MSIVAEKAHGVNGSLVAARCPSCHLPNRLLPWKVVGKYLVLNFRISPYRIPLRELSTYESWLSWRKHLASKTWCSADVASGLDAAAEMMGVIL